MMRYLRYLSLWLFVAFLHADAGEVTFLTPLEFDLGETESGRMIEDAILFVNTGADSIRIKQVKTSCGCTAVETGRKTFAPGDTASIPFKLNTRGFKGTVRKSITIFFENGNPGPKSVRLIVRCVNYVDYEPRYLTFARIQVNPDTLLKQQVQLINHYKKPIRIQSIHTETEIIKVCFHAETIEPGGVYSFEVVLKPDHVSRKSVRLEVEMDNPDIDPIRMPVYIHIHE